jgi:large subunit ribosomal protein L16
MLLKPKKRSYAKFRKGRINLNQSQHKAKALNQLNFGKFALISKVGARCSAKELEAARRIIRFQLKKAGKLWIRAFPDIPITSKPVGVRMGKGKGSVDRWVARLEPGQIIFELAGVSSLLATLAFQKAIYKLGFPCRIIHRKEALFLSLIQASHHLIQYYNNTILQTLVLFFNSYLRPRQLGF